MRIWPLTDKWLSGMRLQIRVMNAQGVYHWEDILDDELPIEDMAEFPEDYRVKP